MMARKIKLFQSKERKSREEASALLRELADKISEGSVILKQGEEQTTLELPQNIIFEIDAKEKRKNGQNVKQKLEIELSWIEGDHSAAGSSFEFG